MAGLTQICESIVGTAKAEAEEILSAARREADAVAADAQSRSQVSAEQVLVQADEKVRGIASSAQSACALDEKNKILAAKMQLIDETFSHAVEKLRGLPQDQYFSVLTQLIKVNALSGAGELILSPADKARLPKSFLETVAAFLPQGKQLVLSSRTDDSLNGGFLLKYDDIEVNCSFEAIVDAEREHLMDTVNTVLFKS